jgi:TonB family protein
MAYQRTIAIAVAVVMLSALAHGGARAADAKSFEVRRLAAPPNDTPYPAAARALNLPGRAMLNCTAAADGAIEDCKVTGEDPPEWGFGDAALIAAPSIHVAPGDADRRVQLPIAFHLDPGEVTDPDLKAPGFNIANSQITWLEKPALQDFVLTYPPDAVKQDIEGFAAVACRVTSEGRLNPCAVIAEQPARQGFDKAALVLAAKYRMATKLVDGRPAAGGVVRQGFSWSLH